MSPGVELPGGTLPLPAVVARLSALSSPEAMVERLRGRDAERAAFVDRAGRWLAGRGGRVELPADRAAIVALGVPCEVCAVVVTEEGQGGHVVEFGAAVGERFGASIVARCGRVGVI